jgi:hypothetical protein
MNPARLRRLAALASLVSAAACSPVEPDGEARLTLHVDAWTVECVAVARHRCLRVRRHPDGEWSDFHDAITGFAHEPGYRYALLVTRRRVGDPPADGSAYAYELVRVLSRVRVAGD